MSFPAVLKQLTPAPVRAALRYLAEYNSVHRQLERVNQAVAKRYNLTVAGGPFRGMRYGNEAFCSGYSPKILGCYESELHEVFEEILKRDYDCIIDIGAAEGYYAVGLARHFQRATIYAFEIVPHVRRLCAEIAQLNGVSERLIIKGACDDVELRSLPLGRRSLVVSDCEGYEFELINPELVPGLLHCDLLVELHDCFDARITPAMHSRFEDTHDIRLIESAPHDPARFPMADFLPIKERALAVDDLRAAKLQWAFMTVRT